ncbi:hypothetical protein Lal_00038939 [Lupinus albus]|uniref:Putative pectinesterase inhibitor domain-containing protein n=1 Tax=Lupinus albus TaxID=3870 RepID=A0A6A5NG29_LUPAL|nr:putative pectinesterase inhibitor domain-containing protein [Lupinus albus]KAF1882293.1 hypothetical protein Lal_00038939 [Lupinus albus]
MYFTKNIFLIISISSFLLLHTTNAIRLPIPLEIGVTKLCSGTTDPTLCFKTILPQMHGGFNRYKALQIEIIAAKNQALKAVAIIDELIKSPSSSQGMKDSLAVCQNQYGNIIDSINEAITTAQQRDAGMTNLKFSAVFSYRSTCEDEFPPEIPPPNLANAAEALKVIGANVLDISKGLENREIRMRQRKGLMPDYSKITSPPSKCLHVVGPCSE